MTAIPTLAPQWPGFKRHAWFILVLMFGLVACKTSSALYDKATFTHTADLKAKTIALMAHGAEPYAKYKMQADSILQEANVLFEKQQLRKKNDLSIQQWKLLLEDNEALHTSGILTGFFQEWRDAPKPLSKFYVNEKRKKVAEAFDEILKLEGAKPKK